MHQAQACAPSCLSQFLLHVYAFVEVIAGPLLCSCRVGTLCEGDTTYVNSTAPTGVSCIRATAKNTGLVVFILQVLLHVLVTKLHMPLHFEAVL